MQNWGWFNQPFFLSLGINQNNISMQFYAPTYLQSAHPNSIQIEEKIIEDLGMNGWDLYTSLQTPVEVEEFIRELI